MRAAPYRDGLRLKCEVGHEWFSRATSKTAKIPRSNKYITVPILKAPNCPVCGLPHDSMRKIEFTPKQKQ